MNGGPDQQQPEWFQRWLEADHHPHGPVPENEVPVGEAQRRLVRRARILDWAQIAALVVPVVMSVVAVAIMLKVLSVAHHVDQRADSVAENNRKLTTTVSAQATDERQLKAIAAALGQLETARTEDEKLDALDALRQAATAATTTTAPARQGAAPAAPTTTAPTRPGPTPTTTTTTTGPTTTTTAPRSPPAPGPTLPCLLPRSAICPGGP